MGSPWRRPRAVFRAHSWPRRAKHHPIFTKVNVLTGLDCPSQACALWRLDGGAQEQPEHSLRGLSDADIKRLALEPVLAMQLTRRLLSCGDRQPVPLPTLLACALPSTQIPEGRSI